jgi:hypothetical protein
MDYFFIRSWSGRHLYLEIIINLKSKIMKKSYKIIKSLAFLALAFSQNAFSQIIPNGTYQIYNTINSQNLTYETLTGESFALMGDPNATDNSQLWTIAHQGGDIYKITSVATGSSLGVKENWCGDFGNVQSRFALTDTNVEFKIVSTSIAGKYVIEIAFTACNPFSSNNPIKAFDIDGGKVNARINTFPVNVDNPNQQFEFKTPGTLSTNSFEAKTFLVLNNPTSSFWKITTNASFINKITIVDNVGKQIKTINPNQSEATIDATSLTNGIYFAKIDGENSSKTLKLVKN